MLELVLGKVLHMSLIGCFSTLVVLLVRFLLIKCRVERKYAYYLWLAVFVNLSVPISVSGVFSLIPRQVMEISLQEGTMEADMGEALPEEGAGGPLAVQVLPAGEPAKVSETLPEAATEGAESEVLQAETQSSLLYRAGVVWLGGILLLALYNLAVLFRFIRELSKKKRKVFKARERIAEVEGLSGPFLWGLFRPITCEVRVEMVLVSISKTPPAFASCAVKSITCAQRAFVFSVGPARKDSSPSYTV